MVVQKKEEKETVDGGKIVKKKMSGKSCMKFIMM